MSSVGELLDQADLKARGLLWDADTHQDGRVMVRGWASVVHAAGDLWRAIPTYPQAAPTAREGGIMAQVEAHTQGLLRALGPSNASMSDPKLEEIADLFGRAAKAITASDVTQLPTQAHARDAGAARTSVMHTLGNSLHAVSLGLRNNVLAERLATTSTARTRSAGELLTRTQMIEDLVAGYYAQTHPESRTEIHRDAIDPDRLGASISGWDVQAQRVLAGTPTARDLESISATMMGATTHAQTLWRLSAQAATQGIIPAPEYRSLVQPALEAMTERWTQTHQLWRPLVHPHQKPSAAWEAGVELSSAFGELARDRIGRPDVKTWAARVDMSEVLQALGRFHVTAVGISQSFDAALRRDPVNVNAPAAAALLHGFQRAGKYTEDELGIPSTVSPRDIHLRRQIPLPQQLRAPTQQLASRTWAATDRAFQATSRAVDHGRVEESQITEPTSARVGRRQTVRPATARLRLIHEQPHSGNDANKPVGPRP